MYDYLEGVLQAIHADSLVLDVGGIGFRIHTPKTCSVRNQPLGGRARLFVELTIREDAHTLFGFASPKERDFFLLLQQVSGIGPKVALNILSHAPVPEIASMLAQRDTKSLSLIPGIGKKLAERIAVELHERVSTAMSPEEMAVPSKAALIQNGQKALQTLGFTAAEARNAISETLRKNPEIVTVEQLVQCSLSAKR